MVDCEVEGAIASPRSIPPADSFERKREGNVPDGKMSSERRNIRTRENAFRPQVYNMTSETVEVARIALRLPPFWKSNVRLWTAQCDHAFTFSGISSDDTKYSALVANLDAETLSTCRTLC
ncbi:hypothetical protein TNCV_1502701 [Trichonephila clavipes]|uniref:DUF7041 domain-containing protein n=1 Tax=Trichonephila clavipes TaxID=2585209 RepID=A0A8X6RTC0_TRICX|nr:hypothetical protein TNCV_1502701 [Trichonephila clavipes]